MTSRQEKDRLFVARRWLAVLAGGVIVALAVGWLTGRIPSEPTPTGEIPLPADRPGAGAAWFQLAATSADTAGGIVSTGFRLAIGRLGGTTAIYAETYPVPLRGEADLVAVPTVAGATDESVIVAYFDGSSSWLREVDVASGGVRASTEIDGVVAAAVRDPTTGDSLVVLHDRTTLKADGLWRIKADGSAEQLAGADEHFDADPARGERTWLAITPDGTTILRWICSGEACRLDGVDARTGVRRFMTVGMDFGRLVGAGNLSAITTSLLPRDRDECQAQTSGDLQFRCPFSIIDLESGQTRLGQPFCEDDIALAQHDPLIVVVASRHPACGSELYQLVVIEADGGRTTPINPTTSGFELVPTTSDQGTSIEGAYVVSRGGDFPFPTAPGTAEVVAVPE